MVNEGGFIVIKKPGDKKIILFFALTAKIGSDFPRRKIRFCYGCLKNEQRLEKEKGKARWLKI